MYNSNVNNEEIVNKICPIFSFEYDIPESIKVYNDSEISLSNKHFKDGKNSLRWNFNKGAKLVINELIGYKEFKVSSKSQARDTFGIWIYNEKPIDDILFFEFGTDDIVNCSFDFRLNYTGWRNAWVMYERDMVGIPKESMNRLTITAPKTIENASIYLDQIIFSNPVDPRFHTRDYQVPFVNLEADKKANSHWLSLYYFTKLRPSIQFHDKFTDKDEKALDLIIERFEKYTLKKQTLTKKDMDTIEEKFLSYNIIRDGNNITGNSINVVHYYDIFPKERKDELIKLSKGMCVKDYTDFMYDIACKYHSTNEACYKNRLKAIFIDLIDHLHDQGWAEGCSFGTTHHLGYNFRKFYEAAVLMRKVLNEAGILDRTQKTMAWFSGVGRIFYEKSEAEGANMDVLNTLLQGMLASILLMKNSVKKICYIESFTKWVEHSLAPAPGIMGPFKVDGSTYHHCNHYPAYAEGGLNGICPVVYFLSGTPYRINTKSHEQLTKIVMSVRLYCNKYEWLVSLSSRHPNGKGALNIEPFKYMALAGSPTGKENIDKEVAAAYLRLISPNETEVGEYFKSLGIKAECDPEGHWTMNYAVLSIHRRENWLIGARGHSKYLWANETYKNANLYGRYITHGQVQIMNQGNPINNADSGFAHGGWDWNRWPGTTTIHLPIDKLKSDVKNLDTFSGFEEMLISDESFAGGCNIEGKNGMFAMKLHDHPKYEGTHRAYKSVFFFDNRIIFLGSNIENMNSEFYTETTLFQNHLDDINEKIWINELAGISDFPYEKDFRSNDDTWIVDNKNNGYYIPKGQNVKITKTIQKSKAQNTCEDTKGDFVSAWINHGKAPKAECYEYTILVNTTIAEISEFTQRMKSPQSALYTILQKDAYAHIVHDNETDITGYALFEANNNINKGHILGIDTPTMIMAKEEKDSLILSICDPDLRLYSGVDEDQYDENGNRKEVSVYSRKWRESPSKISAVKLVIKGKWQLKMKTAKCKILSTNVNETILEFYCSNAEVIEIKLNKK